MTYLNIIHTRFGLSRLESIAKSTHYIIYSVLIPLAITMSCLLSCVDEEEYDDSPAGNFEALWKIMDEHYCFFDYKGVNWNEVHDRYRKRIDSNMSSAQLFEVLTDMLAELKDGHVNLSSSADFGRYWNWHEDFPSNFSDSLQRRYLGTDYKIASALKYKVLDDNIGYVYCESFNSGIGDGNLDDVIMHLMLCQGLIIDIRNNSGGLLTNAEKLAARFVEKETMVGYIQHKTGKGHNEFSEMKQQWLKPSSNLRWHKPVVVLTNRKVYSAANEFVKYMRATGKAVIIGDKTGGGAGLPFTSSLPCGWSVRFSACPMYDHNGQSTEFGIEPDHNIDITADDYQRGTDTILEYARQLISNH